METWIRRRVIYRGPVFSVVSGEAMTEDGQTVTRDVVTHVGSVAVVPVTDNRVLLVRQFRISVGREVVEIPAGRIEIGEDPEFSARRELEEELGYRAGRLVRGSSYYSSVGFLDEQLHIFLAFDLTRSETNREPDEKIEEVEMSLDSVREALVEKRFEDSKTIIGLHELVQYLSVSSESL